MTPKWMRANGVTSDGTWTSKCGDNEDIRHFTLDALEGYGHALTLTDALCFT
jgi:hypothetical protein